MWFWFFWEFLIINIIFSFFTSPQIQMAEENPPSPLILPDSTTPTCTCLCIFCSCNPLDFGVDIENLEAIQQFVGRDICSCLDCDCVWCFHFYTNLTAAEKKALFGIDRALLEKLLQTKCIPLVPAPRPPLPTQPLEEKTE